MEKINLNFGSRSYDVTIGSELTREIKNFLSGKNYSRNILIVSDTNVFPLYGEKVENIFKEAGFEAAVYVANAGETAKSLGEAQKIYTKAIEEHIDRKSLIVALGGGVVGDLAGFIAATYLRGVPLMQIPTTLLAAVDSCVGGKVAVNHELGKNLIGAFYQPDAVFIDTDFLKGLPIREIRAGYGEIVKYGIIRDESFIRLLEENIDKTLNAEDEIFSKIIAKSVEIKADVVTKDEHEGGLRRILNFGHTVGHAIEKETKFKIYNHGEAVAIGMVAAMKIAENLNLIESKDLKRVETLLNKLQLPTRSENVNLENITESMQHDKKVINGKINFVLPIKIGDVVVKNDVPKNVVEEAVRYIIG